MMNAKANLIEIVFSRRTPRSPVMMTDLLVSPSTKHFATKVEIQVLQQWSLLCFEVPPMSSCEK